MTKSTQILDVAYGTFSCRLEGFEDSVETMKTVVSYFHDLAGHDRFMDVDPQAPDMETLALLTAEQADADIEIAGEGQNVSLRVAEDDADDDVDLAEDFAADEVAAEDADEDDIENFVADDDDDEPANVFQADDAPIVLTADEDDESAFDDDDFTHITDEDDYVEDLEDTDADQPAMADEVDNVAEDDEDESIAAKLQRIRAVVGRGHVQPDAAPAATSDDLDDDDDDTPVVNPLAQRLADLAKRNLELAAADAAAAQEDDHEEFDDVVAEQDEDDADESGAFDETNEEAALSLSAAALVDDEESFEDDDDVVQAHDPLVLTPASNDDEGSNLDTADLDDEDEDDSFDLSAELNDVARTIEERDAHRPQVDELHQSPDTAFSRILNQTDEHLNAPEGRRNRDAFAQLKAAVAATEAARELGDDSPSVAKGDAFREDLGALDAAEKSETREASPLRLVPSQTPASTDAPVDAAADRLRQIAAKVEENMAPKTGGFAEFAAEQGATDLSDLLEAAAAYIAFVEGDDDFSRPQVMKKVQSASDEEISREDGLRSFGRLLRQSRIIKLNNGRFQVAENTRFRPNGTDA